MSTRRRTGFTLAELLISMTVAMVVITGATAFSVSSWKTRRGWTVKESVDRGARFVGLSLARDVAEAGIAMESTPTFASLGTFGDTLSVLSVPYEPNESPVYPIYNDGDPSPTYPPGGNCGETCIELVNPGGAVALVGGNLAKLQVGSTRRLLLITSVASASGGRFRVEFLNVSRLLGRDSGLDSLLLERSGTTLQKLNVAVYWRDGSNKLYRATRLSGSGAPIGELMASNVQDFEASLLFVSDTESPYYDGLDADTLNDGNDIIGAKIRAQMQSDRSDPSVNGGQRVMRWYEWKVAPRNLLYEKNRSN